MRKRILNSTDCPERSEWLDLERLAELEVTSEDAAHPIEAALTGAEGGWRAAGPGEQIIRLRFDDSRNVRRIALVFYEAEVARTQEFVLRWSSDGKSYSDVVRQQYTFSPPHTTREFEDYQVQLAGARAVELRILPDIAGNRICASVAEFRIA